MDIFKDQLISWYDSSGNIYVTDLYGHRVQKFNSSLVYQAKVGSYSTHQVLDILMECMWIVMIKFM